MEQDEDLQTRLNQTLESATQFSIEFEEEVC